MSLRSAFAFVNFKAIFCLIFAVTLAKYVYTQNLYTAVLDETRNTLMSFSSGSSSPSPTPSTARKIIDSVNVPILHVHKVSFKAAHKPSYVSKSGKSSLSISCFIFFS